MNTKLLKITNTLVQIDRVYGDVIKQSMHHQARLTSAADGTISRLFLSTNAVLYSFHLAPDFRQQNMVFAWLSFEAGMVWPWKILNCCSQILATECWYRLTAHSKYHIHFVWIMVRLFFAIELHHFQAGLITFMKLENFQFSLRIKRHSDHFADYSLSFISIWLTFNNLCLIVFVRRKCAAPKENFPAGWKER